MASRIGRGAGSFGCRTYSSTVRIAALDLGSNSFHLLVVEAHPDGSFEPLLREKDILRLGDAVARWRRLPDELVSQAVESVRRMKALCDSVAADEVVACGTAALREAENGSELVDRIDAETGVRVRVISGKAEAKLVFAAVRSSVLIDPGPALCLDLGGGSLEMSVGDARGLMWSTSVKLGVARLTADAVRSDPPTAADTRRLVKRIEAVLAPTLDAIRSRKPRMVIGSSGTFLALARMAAAHRTGEVPTAINQLTVRSKDVAAVHERLMTVSTAERQKLPGVDARRADLLPAGSTLLITALDLFGFDEFTVSDWALREGIVIDAISRHDPAEWDDDPRAPRRASVLALCRRCNWDEDHSRQVAALATQLFDSLAPLHGLSAADRELLEYAALLHDIGEHVSIEGHEKHTAYLIENGRLRGFDPDEVATLTCIGRFHRRSNPKPSFPPYAALGAKGRDRVDRLTALLRVADGLDRSHSAAVDGIATEISDSSVSLSIESSTEVDVELWGLRRKRELFEKVFDRTLEIAAAEVPAPARAPSRRPA